MYASFLSSVMKEVQQRYVISCTCDQHCSYSTMHKGICKLSACYTSVFEQIYCLSHIPSVFSEVRILKPNKTSQFLMRCLPCYCSKAYTALNWFIRDNKIAIIRFEGIPHWFLVVCPPPFAFLTFIHLNHPADVQRHSTSCF